MRVGCPAARQLTRACAVGDAPTRWGHGTHAAGTTYRVVKASSTSHDTYADATEQGDATTHWKLRPKRDGVPNGGSLQRMPIGTIGLVRFNLRGVYRTDITGGDQHCSLTAATGSTEYGLVAPETGMVAFAGKGKRL